MGVKSGSEALYHMTGLSRADVAAICRGLYEDRRGTDGFTMSQPTIDGDSNNICCVIARNSDNKSVLVGAYYRDWALCGLNVAPIVDGDVRPTCKQATNVRIANKEKARIRGHVLLKEVHTMRRNIVNGVYSSDELADVKKQIAKKEKQSRTSLASADHKMPQDFAEALEDVLVNDLCVRSPNNTGGFVSSVLKAKFQADAAIIGRFVNGKTLMAITSDSDMPIVAGDSFIALKDFTKDGKMTLVSTSKDTLQLAFIHLPEESKEFVRIENASCPIFEGVQSRKMRALMMVTLGCDVYGPGVKGVGPPRLVQILNQLKETITSVDDASILDERLFKALSNYTSTNSGLGFDTVRTLIQAIMFEPTNYTSIDNATGETEMVEYSRHV